MPYRRLPNTDQARVRALNAAVNKGDRSDIRQLPFTLHVLSESRNFLKRFEVAHSYYTNCYEAQVNESGKHQANVKIARLYLSHFIQVLHMCIARGEIKAEVKRFYGIAIDVTTLPDLTSEANMVEWSKKIVEGEQKRVAMGGVPIYNPTIARVKVHCDLFIQSYEKQKALQALTNKSLEELSAMRSRADELILSIWNCVEEKFQNISVAEERLTKCREYGLIYYYRTGERQPQLF